MKVMLNSLPEVKATLQPFDNQDVLGLDEVQTYVQKRTNKQSLCTAICRRTRQIVAYVIGDRNVATCQKLYEAIPENYRKAHTCSDLWGAYKVVSPEATHTSAGKESGLTNHMER